ncbi:TPA: hypothetical protein ACSCYS_003425 [Aeromonas veronii]
MTNLPKKKTTLNVYHGSDVDFVDFQFVGKRLTSMGLGHYFTPSLKKASEYGPIVKKFKVTGNIFDWGNPPEDFRDYVFSILKNSVSDDVLAGYSSIKKRCFEKSEQGTLQAKSFYYQKKDETKDRWHDRSKATVGEENGMFVISWRDAENLNDINNEMLMNLCQNYCHEIIAELGYDGAMFSSEVVIYNKECIRSVKLDLDCSGPGM